jgi:SAM-dependent methyltransferase
MDEVAAYNIARWNALANADAVFTRPALGLDASSAREMIDPEDRLGEIDGKDVLCLAAGGGQQSAAFALLGARVTVVDLSVEQLRRDQEAAAHYQVHIETRQGDMRDLSPLAADSFDLVWQPYSINFAPDARTVFRHVARVMRGGGLYYLQCANPFYSGLGEADWNGEGYNLKHPYQDGAEITYVDAAWVHAGAEQIPGPREYRHTLSTVVNGLVEHGFVIQHLSEWRDLHPDPNATPGTWQHFTAIAPPWLALWMVYRPSIFG